MDKHGSAHWEGGIKDGQGTISTASGALKDRPYGFQTRFEDKPGTNPEELIGAAHAACFAMALSLELGHAGFVAEAIHTKSTITLEKDGDGFSITGAHLDLSAKIPGITDAQFREIAHAAATGCPVSKLLDVDVDLDATLAT